MKQEIFNENELERIKKSNNINNTIHSLIHLKYEQFGYDETIQSIRLSLENITFADSEFIVAYLTEVLDVHKTFMVYRDEILSLLKNENFQEFEEWVYKLSKKSFSKKEIFKILLELHVYIQYNVQTKNDLVLNDNLEDFLGCFVEEGLGHKILPNESIR